MTDRQSDYIRTDRLDDAFIPLDILETLFQVSRWTIDRWLTADRITRHEYPGGKAVRWGDIPKQGKRWKRPTTT